jgi:uncharacterized membrane protein
MFNIIAIWTFMYWGPAAMRNFTTEAARVSAVHHSLAAAFVTLYGYHVCNIISGLDLLVWAATLVPVILAQWLIRGLIVSVAPSARPADAPVRAFSLEFLVFALGGGLIGIINAKVHGVPIMNGVKVALSFLALGLFAAVEQAILSVRQRLDHGGLPDAVKTVRLSLAARLSWLLATMIALVVSISGALMLRLLDEPGPDVGRALAIELAVLFVSFLAYISYLATRARTVFALALAEQLAALDQVELGGAFGRARIGMRNEMGMVSTRINRMLDALQASERQRVRSNAAMLRGLIGLAGARDNETGQHLARTQSYIELLAVTLAKNPRYSAALTPEVIMLLSRPRHSMTLGKWPFQTQSFSNPVNSLTKSLP